MNPEERKIGRILVGLRQASVPPLPALAAAVADRSPVPVGRMLAAAGMLLALVGLLYLVPGRAEDPARAIAGRLDSAEARLSLVDHEELRTLLRREIELLRIELDLAR